MMVAAAELREWVAQTTFESDNVYLWRFGRVSHDPGRVRFKPTDGYPLIVAELAQDLYERFYSRADPRNRRVADRLVQQEFLGRLAHANASRWSWSGGWEVVERGESEYRVRRRGGEVVVVAKQDFDEAGDGTGRARVLKGSAGAQPGWYHVRGEREYDPSGGPTLRVYWNTARAGACPLVRVITTELNALELAFHFKVLDNPLGFGRADAAVLYVAADCWAASAPGIERAHRAVAHYLRPDTPALSKRLGRGIALAENPRSSEDEEITDESFGSHRCRLIAEGIWDAFVDGDATPEARLAAVHERLRSGGVRSDAPHLNAGSEDIYGLSVTDSRLPLQSRVIAQ